MLTINLPEQDMYDGKRNEFFTLPSVTLTLEHSLLSIAKWESVWHKPYISTTKKTREETVDYIRCMMLNKGIDPIRLKWIPDSVIQQIQDYIDDSMTATWFKDGPLGKRNSQAITSELIYSWMVAAQIPFDPVEKWHLNRLLVLIRICSENANPKKMSKREVMNQHRALNAARRAKHK